MDSNQIQTLLRRISQLWNNYPLPDADALEMWELALADEAPEAAVKAVLYLAKHDKSEFGPSLKKLLFTIEEQKSGGNDAAELAWSSKGRNSELAAEAWREWGGDSRWGALPDPRYCEDSGKAESQLSFARKEFLELYAALEERQRQGHLQIDHQTAVNVLERVNRALVERKQQKRIG